MHPNTAARGLVVALSLASLAMSPAGDSAPSQPAQAASQTVSSSPTPAGAAAQASLIRGHVESIEEVRSTQSTRTSCRLNVVFLADDVDDGSTVSEVRVDAAADEFDRDLVPKSTSDRPPMSLMRPRILSGQPLRSTVVLRTTSRRATMIKFVEGSADIFSPNESNGGLVRIRDVADMPAPATLENEALAKLGIELKIVTDEEAAEARRSGFSTFSFSRSAPEERVRLDAVAAEVARRRAEREVAASGTPQAAPKDSETKRARAEAIAQEVAKRRAEREALAKKSGESKSASAPSASTKPEAVAEIVPEHRTPERQVARRSTTRLTIQVTDPGEKLMDFEWQDASGRPLRTRGMNTFGKFRTVEFVEPLPIDAQLAVFVASDGAISQRRFRIENVVLP